MKRTITFLLLISLSLNCYSQKNTLKDKLYELENEIISGDINALKEIAIYLDDTTFVQEFLGYHNYPNNARRVALRIIEENCLFTGSELKIDSTLSTSIFLNFVKNAKVIFDDLTGMFLVTPLTERKTSYELKRISNYDMKRVDTIVGVSAYPFWYYENQIDGFLVSKNPEALKWIASAWFHTRTRFNRYYFNDEEFLDLIKKLIHVELGVPDENGKITFLYKNDYNAKARLNYLIYWTNHYNDYKWNDKLGVFENVKEGADEKGKEEIFFELLNSEDDSIAINAYTQLTEMDTARVTKLAKEYDFNDIDNNYSLPTFLYRFIQQTVLVTQYCRDNEINYKASGWVLDSLKKLKKELTYPDRYRLEDNMISKLSLDEITSVEYYGLIYEQEWDLTYSLGRILDKFYSKNLDNLVKERKQLQLFLKKAELFDRIGIIGICNKYLKKLISSNETAISKVREIFQSTNDAEILISAKKVIDSYASAKKNVLDKKVKVGKIKKYGVVGFKEKYKVAIGKCKDEYGCRSKVAEIVGLINYDQLGDVMQILMKDTIFNSDELVSILEGNFGIPSSSLEDFFQIYRTKNQHDLYAFYFNKTGINYLNEQGEFLYEKIYDILKYDIVDAFVGGGGGRRDDGIYPLIKLLELKFKTTLGFSEKLCDSGYPNMVCGPEDMARAWMKFLETKNLVVSKHFDPVSISD